MRNELLRATETDLEYIGDSLEREFKNLLVVVVSNGETSDIYLVNDEKGKPYLFRSLESVIDYKYDGTGSPAMLAKIRKDDKVYWLGFIIHSMITRYADTIYYPWKCYLTPLFSVSKGCTESSEADFISGFSYLKAKKAVDINGIKYMFDCGGYGNHQELDDVQPMYGCYYLTTRDGKQRIESGIYPYEFGPYVSITPWEDGMYPYVHPCFHGYFGRDENGFIQGMRIMCDSSQLDVTHREDYPFLFTDFHLCKYNYVIKFEKPVESVEFVKRDFERTDSHDKYAGVDVWKLIYADGTRAIMLHTIGNLSYAMETGNMFRNFVLQEDYMKGIF